MAYRFLLEVPESLAAEASVAVEQAADAQVLLVRQSHGLGFEDEFVDLTVATHSLRIIDTLYDWFDRLGASRPDIRLVLHSGERVALEAVDRGAMVATIRQDQPWVERALPKIGEHEQDAFASPATAPAGPLGVAIDAVGANAQDAALSDRNGRTGNTSDDGGRRIHLRRLNHIAVRVLDLAKAERFYEQFLGMDVVGRARRGQSGALEPVDGEYRWDEATLDGSPADVTFLQNGALTLALERAGRGGRLYENALSHVSVAVDPATFTTLRGEALVRSMTVTANSGTSFTFHDPFGIGWEITVGAPQSAVAR
ncbi:MAG: VOC family protein [Chloroflexia bacterium]|nr:VOC family protein [Chloroflexia bacterium]